MKNDLYREAILDAKAVRAGAIANAKAMLQEAFEPKIQEMLRLKLSEELEEDLEETYHEDGMEEGYHEDGMEEGYGMEEEGTISEADLDEILSELEGLEEADEDTMEEGEDELHEGEDHVKEAEDDDQDDTEDSEEGAEEAAEEDEVDDETKVVDITLGDLKDVLASYMAGQTADEEGMEDMEDMGADAGGDDLSLDEILAELDEENIEEGEDHIEEAKGGSGMTKPGKATKGNPSGYTSVGGSKTTGYDEKVGGKGRTGYDAGSKKLHEATKTIEILSEKLKEINLLNAKLLYMNKIFKAKNLNESQKVSVVKSFDKATSVKEVKTVYEILNESMSNKAKTPLKESHMQGFASKPAGMAPKKPIVDSDPTVDRWQTLVFGNK